MGDTELEATLDMGILAGGGADKLDTDGGNADALSFGIKSQMIDLVGDSGSVSIAATEDTVIAAMGTVAISGSSAIEISTDGAMGIIGNEALTISSDALVIDGTSNDVPAGIIRGIADPLEENDVATKAYVDQAISEALAAL